MIEIIQWLTEKLSEGHGGVYCEKEADSRAIKEVAHLKVETDKMGQGS